MIISSLITGKTIEELFGYNVCIVYWITLLIHNFNLIIGSVGMAFFRYICVKFQRFAFNRKLAELTIRRIFYAELFISGFLFIVAILSFSMVGTNIRLQFATGRSTKMVMILSRKVEEDIEMGLSFLSMNAMIVQLLVVLELFFYLQLYFVLRESTKRNSALDKGMKNLRLKRNSVTLIGQIISFVVEIFCSMIFLLFTIFGFESSIYTTIQLIGTALITLTLILSSPEIRRKYFWFD